MDRRDKDANGQMTKQGRKKVEDLSFAEKFSKFSRKATKFVTRDMWRIAAGEVGGMKGRLLSALKIVYISIAEFINLNVYQKASALTYTTLLSLVPFVAILLSIAAGFGMQESVQTQLFNYFPAHQTELSTTLEFVQRYMSQIQGGMVIVVGVLILLYTVISLMVTVEDTFNEIWHITESRAWSKRLLGYFAAFIILPVLMAASAGANVFISSFEGTLIFGDISLSPVIETLLRTVPYLVVTLVLTGLYCIMPNTKVRFSAALIAGVVSGTAFQLFQLLYISGQIWVSRYNAIYGSFAAIPLLLLFIQLSWLICLFGVQLTYAIQNIARYAYKGESEHISRRYIDLIAIVIMEKVCKAFKYQTLPYDAERLARECNLPVVIINNVLAKLSRANLILVHHVEKDPYAPIYLPKIDTSQVTIGRVLSALDRLGAERFKIDIHSEYAPQWEIIRNSRIDASRDADRLIVDL